MAMLTLVAAVALAGGWLGSGSGARLPSARFAGRAGGCPRPLDYRPRLEPGSDWLTVRGGGPEPVSARPGHARRELRALVPGATSCTYQLVFRVPPVSAGTYPVDVLYRTVAGAANLPAVAFTVTR